MSVMSPRPKCGCGQNATTSRTQTPWRCGMCCYPSSGNHGKDKRRGEQKEGSKQGQNSLAKRRRGLDGWYFTNNLQDRMLEIPGMRGCLESHRMTPRQFVRRVLQYYLNSAFASESVDPLSAFPVHVREMGQQQVVELLKKHWANGWRGMM